jgi:hypothetical protein
VDEGRPTIGVKLEDVEIAVGVGGDDVELFAYWEDFCSDYFHVVGLLAEKSHFVGLFTVACKPDSFQGIGEHAQTRTGQFLDGCDIRIHVHECDG